MKFTNTRRSGLLILFFTWIAGGCTAPPSVAPLLRVAERAMRDEAARVEADTKRDAAQIDQARQAIAAGFDADLAGVTALDRQWVKDATEAYAAAREELLRHELAVQAERRQRADNLRAAADAQERAIGMLERQDQLIVQTTGLGIWRLSATQPFTLKETP